MIQYGRMRCGGPADLAIALIGFMLLVAWHLPVQLVVVWSTIAAVGASFPW